MLKRTVICSLAVGVSSLCAQTPFITPFCSVPAQTVNGNIVSVTTNANTDMGAVISGAVAQALAQGSNTVQIHSDGNPAPMSSVVILDKLSNFTVQMDPGVTLYGAGNQQALFIINGGYNVKLLGGKMIGGYSAPANSCVSAIGTDGGPLNTAELANFECTATKGQGVIVSGSGTSIQNVQNVSVHNNNVHDTGSLNIFATAATNVCVQYNKLSNPSVGGINGAGDPNNFSSSFMENLYFGQNDVSGTPYFFRQPNAYNTPPSGFYSYASMNVFTDTNTFHDSQCTATTCSGDSTLPDQSAIHDDTVIGAQNVFNQISGYGHGIACELSWNCNVTWGSIHDIYGYGVVDESNVSENQINALSSTNGLSNGRGQLTTTTDTIQGVPTSVVQSVMPGNGIAFYQNLGSVHDAGRLPIAEMWIKSAQGEPAGGYEIWFSADDNVFNSHTHYVLPALPAGQWVRVAVAPPHIGLTGLMGVKTWALVNPGNPQSDTISVSDFRQIADSRNNTYAGISIARNGAYPLAVAGCGSNTNFFQNNITDPGTTGSFAYTNSGMLGQVFIGGYNNCTRTGVHYFDNTVTINTTKVPLGGSEVLNISNYGGNSTITNVTLHNNLMLGAYGSSVGPYVVNNQGANSTVLSPQLQ